MRRVVFAQLARRDLERIETHWINDRPDYIADFLIAAQTAFALIKENPGIGSPTGSAQLRRWRIGKTPYLMLYRFNRTELRIMRVHHESQNWRPVSE